MNISCLKVFFTVANGLVLKLTVQGRTTEIHQPSGKNIRVI